VRGCFSIFVAGNLSGGQPEMLLSVVIIQASLFLARFVENIDLGLSRYVLFGRV
jgi:hypothetical protein